MFNWDLVSGSCDITFVDKTKVSVMVRRTIVDTMGHPVVLELTNGSILNWQQILGVKFPVKGVPS